MEDVILLADPNTTAWDFAEKINNYIKTEKDEEVPIVKLGIEVFRNKEIMPFVDDNIRKKDVYLVQSSNKLPNDWWAELLLIKDLCLSASVKSLSFVLPNMYYPRQDRKTKSRVPISARAVARSLYSHKTERIITMDLHSPQIQGFYDESIPIDNLYSFPTVVEYVRKNHYSSLENLAIVSPDAGGVDRAMSFLKRLRNANKKDEAKHNYSFAFTHKLRSKPGEIDEMFFIGDVKDKDAIIIDDMYDSCGTVIESGKMLKENGARKVFAYATHGLFTKGTKDILENFDAVMTSNTQYIPSEADGKIEIIDMAPLFAEAIYRAQKGLSISKLFD
jgi:ribose-phosphate pyrophosphokinase